MTDDGERGAQPVGGATAEFWRGMQPVGGAVGIQSPDGKNTPAPGVETGSDTQYGAFSTGQNDILSRLIELTRDQNPCWVFHYNGDIPLDSNTWLEIVPKTWKGTYRFEDLRVDGLSTRQPASQAPSFLPFLGGVYLYYFSATQDNMVYFSIQIPHAWIEGTFIEPHVHWVPSVNGALNAKVGWGLEYTFADVGGVFGATNTIYANQHMNGDASLVQNEHYVTSFGSIAMPTNKVSTILVCRLFRDGDGSGITDDYTGTAGLLYFDCHVPVNGIGSQEEYVKYDEVYTDGAKGGAIPIRNGFLAGMGVAVHSKIQPNECMAFRVYRNGVATPCIFVITDRDNDNEGNVRSREFNTNPYIYYSAINRDSFHFKAGERITIKTEDPRLQDYTVSDDIEMVQIFLYYVYDITTNETLIAQNIAGGIFGNTAPLTDDDYTSGGEGEGGEGGEGGGEDPGGGGGGVLG